MVFSPPGFARYDYNNVLQQAKSSMPHLQIIILADLFHKYQVTSNSLQHKDFEPFLESKVSAPWNPDATISCHDMVNIQFTSGSTGLPKPVSLSHYNIMNCGRNIWLQTRLTSEDRICCPVPLFHSFGMIVGKLQPPSSSYTHVILILLTSDCSHQHQHRCRLVPRFPIRALQCSSSTSLY